MVDFFLPIFECQMFRKVHPAIPLAAARQLEVKLKKSVIGPAYASGCIWGVGFACMMKGRLAKRAVPLKKIADAGGCREIGYHIFGAGGVYGMMIENHDACRIAEMVYVRCCSRSLRIIV